MISINNFIKDFIKIFPDQKNLQPWDITANLEAILNNLILKLDNNFEIKKGIAIHKTATIESGVILKAPVIICENCFVGAHAYLRGGVYLGKSSVIGPSCEIKTSIILRKSAIAHFNFIGDSIIGNNVNFEAGAHTANHYNERTDKSIWVIVDSKNSATQTEKFGSLIGDNSKIGANAVLSPGTILMPDTIVKRLELVEQIWKPLTNEL
jgi:UDP-N-acetylglucosamine diphosphorylase / glucose-1-phosphate thymidylyltransferase / UDP-N-acetylgalactosamine diphosphorylase / glucosamine-1-phosphate N-acetyltransferase / galactosamine-1-phosphate N-acetyltransferase